MKRLLASLARGVSYSVRPRRGLPMRHRLATSLKRLFIVFCLLFVGACNSSPTLATTPTPPPPTNTPPPDSANQVRVTGRVTDERGIPIAGASLSVSVY